MHVRVSKRHFLSVLMHYGSLDKYVDGKLITQMNLVCGVAPLYVHTCIHTCRAMSADRARLKAVNEMCVSRRLLAIGDKNQFQLKPPLFSVLNFGFIQEHQLLQISAEWCHMQQK